MLAADYSDARPSPSALKAAGYVAVYRYLAPLPNPKVITATEMAMLKATGLGLGLVWEAGGQAALGGAAQGHADALEANRQADLLGWPASLPIFYAVDFDVTADQMGAVSAYYVGTTSGRRSSRLYGPAHVLDELKVGGWQAAGWNPTGLVSLYASILQRITPTAWPNNGTLDENDVIGNDNGLWFFGQSAPAPTPVPIPPEVPVDNLVIIHDTTSLTWRLLNTAVDKWYAFTGNQPEMQDLVSAGVKVLAWPGADSWVP